MPGPQWVRGYPQRPPLSGTPNTAIVLYPSHLPGKNTQGVHPVSLLLPLGSAVSELLETLKAYMLVVSLALSGTPTLF